MYSVVKSAAVNGLDGYVVNVEADASSGLPCLEMVGMLSGEVKEAKERVRVALKNVGYSLPPLHITVNLSPANIRKSGTRFDVSIAIALLESLGELEENCTEGMLLVGELGLGGEIQFVSGVLPTVTEARNRGIKTCIVPECNVYEGAVVEGIDVVGMKDLRDVIRYISLNKEERDDLYPPVKKDIKSLFVRDLRGELDFADVGGQEGLKRAAVIATAGFHHLLMVGPPGAGKTMVAKRIPSILPPLSIEESLEVTNIYSIGGLLKDGQSLVTHRPFSNPHHTISQQALAGGGTIPRPGAISLAHRGVLFLDEAVHFSSAALEVMRQPMEDRKIVISRSCGNFTFPADFMLVAAINPCPCGYYPDRNRCRCTQQSIDKYLSKLSGPILDRIDICVEASAVKLEELKEPVKSASSLEMREMVERARRKQEERYAGTRFRFNGELGPKEINEFCKLGRREQEFIDTAYTRLELSARAYHKVIKVARTIADIEGSDGIKISHLAEALNYRMNIGSVR